MAASAATSAHITLLPRTLSFVSAVRMLRAQTQSIKRLFHDTVFTKKQMKGPNLQQVKSTGDTCELHVQAGVCRITLDIRTLKA